MRAAGEWESSCWCSECGRVSAAPGFLFLAELRDHFWHGGGFPGPRTSGVGLVPGKGPDRAPCSRGTVGLHFSVARVGRLGPRATADLPSPTAWGHPVSAQGLFCRLC